MKKLLDLALSGSIFTGCVLLGAHVISTMGGTEGLLAGQSIGMIGGCAAAITYFVRQER
jgi:hypothetical protein